MTQSSKKAPGPTTCLPGADKVGTSADIPRFEPQNYPCWWSPYLFYPICARLTVWRQRHVRCTFSATNTDACIPRGFYLYVYSSLRLAHFSGMRILEMWTVIKAQLAPSFFVLWLQTLSLWERRFTNHYRNRNLDCPLIRTVFDQDSTDKQDSLQSNMWVVMFICSSMILCHHMMSSSSYRISHKSLSFEFISNYKNIFSPSNWVSD